MTNELAQLGGALADRFQRYEGTVWDESNVPTEPGAVLVADGFWTSSVPLSPMLPRDHWSVPIRNAIRASRHDVAVHALSYSSPGFNYGPHSTMVNLLSTSHTKFLPYSHIPRPFVGLGFSLGSHVLTVGMVRYPPRRQSGEPCTIVQVQTPLQLASDYQSEAIMSGGAASVAFQLQYGHDAIQRNFLSSSARLIELGYRITFVFWPGDEFTVFPDSLLERVESTGATLLRVPEITTRSSDPFVQHGQVADDPAIVQAVTALLFAPTDP